MVWNYGPLFEPVGSGARETVIDSAVDGGSALGMRRVWSGTDESAQAIGGLVVRHVVSDACGATGPHPHGV
jgi:hypothetical protein